MLDLRFPTALQTMLSLALAQDSGIPRLSSAELAEGLGANPSFVRKLLVQLASHGLVVSTMGKAGGVSLARSAREITLSEIYAAATEGKPLWTPRQDVPHRCVVTSNIETFFKGLADDAEHAVRDVLSKKSLAKALAELHALDRRRARASTRTQRGVSGSGSARSTSR